MNGFDPKMTAFAPATVANVACGFDLLGFALEEPGDEVTAVLKDPAPDTKISGIQVSIGSIKNDDGKLPLAPEKNTAGYAVQSMLSSSRIEALLQTCSHLNNKIIELHIEKKMPFGSGLGSSAASAAAAVCAVNALLGNPFTKKELLPFSVDGESIASGAKHADNVAPSLLGGFVMVSATDTHHCIHLPAPASLCAAVIYPHVQIRTKDSRTLLPPSVPFRDAVLQTEYIGGLIAGLYKEDFALIARSLHDRLAEPYRAAKIPCFDQMKQAALNCGALGCSISGSGPSVFALAGSKKQAEEAGEAMLSVMNQSNIPADLYISAINHKGAVIINADAAS